MVDVVTAFGGIAVAVAVIWYMYHVIDGIFERSEPAAAGMISLAGLFVICEYGVAAGLNLLVIWMRGSPSMMLLAEMERARHGWFFPVVLMAGLVWFLWNERHLHRRLAPVLLTGGLLTLWTLLR